jgi:hypothetical protein
VTAKSALTAWGAVDEEGDSLVLREPLDLGQVRGIRQSQRRHLELVFAGQVERRPARHEQFQLRCRSEQLAQCRRRIHEMFEVVEQEQDALVSKGVLQRLRLLRADRLSERWEQQGGVGDRLQRDEEDALREFLDELRRRLECEPRLPGAAGSGEGQQADVRPLKQLRHRCQLALASDQWSRLDGQVGRPVLERAERRELLSQAGDQELRQSLRAGQVLEAVLTEITKRHPVAQLFFDELARRLREQHLSAVCSRAYARGSRDVEPHVAARRERRLARVDAHADAQRRLAKFALQTRRAHDGGARAGKGREERVALRVDDVSVRITDGRVDEAPVLGEQVAVGVTPDRREQLGRALDVGKKERDRPGRQLAHVSSVTPATFGV